VVNKAEAENEMLDPGLRRDDVRKMPGLRPAPCKKFEGIVEGQLA